MDKHTEISSMSAIDRLIEMQEFRDRMIAVWILKDCCTGTNLKMWRTNLKDPVDLRGECMFMGSTFKFNVEIKERMKNEELQKLYPHATLRVDKYNRMREKTEYDTNLLYMLLQNEKTCYLFNLSALNWNKVDTFNWKIKKTQMDNNSGYKEYLTYAIPYDQAFLTLDCSNYYEEYRKRYIDVEDAGDC